MFPSLSEASSSHYLSWLFFGHSRIEWTHLYRPDGAFARQLVLSVGVPPFGRLATRMTLHDLTGRPTAFHGEIILGPKIFSVGASLGRSRNELISQWFYRHQPSLTTTHREVKRVVVGERGAQVQVMGEVKLYGSSLSTIEMGTAYAYQFEREHYREALRLAEQESAAAAASYLKERYPHIQERWVREGLLPARGRYAGFVAESAAIVALGLGLENFLEPGPFLHSLQNGGAFGLGYLYRAGFRNVSWRGLGFAVAEGLPVTVLHYLSGSAFDALENRTGFRLPQRWILQDFATLGSYASLKALFYPRFPGLPQAAGAEAGLSWASHGPGFRFLQNTAAILLGGWTLYSLYRKLKHASLDWESYERQTAPLERKRWLANDDFKMERGGYALWEEYQGRLRFSFTVRRGPRRRISSGHFILARLLEGCEALGPLTGALRSRRARSLPEALEGLSPPLRRRLEKSFGKRGLEELLCIAAEPDAEIFWTSLQELARRQQENERYDSAASLYYLAQLGERSPERKRQARRKLEECLMAGGRVVEEGFLRLT